MAGHDRTQDERKKVKQEEPKEIKLEDLNDFEINPDDIRRLKKSKNITQGGVKDIEYTVYKASNYGKLANSFFENFSE